MFNAFQISRPTPSAAIFRGDAQAVPAANEMRFRPVLVQRPVVGDAMPEPKRCRILEARRRRRARLANRH